MRSSGLQGASAAPLPLIRFAARSTSRSAAATSGPTRMLSTISSMKRLSNKPSLASSTVSRVASCNADPTSTRMSGEPITLNSTWRWS
ncbi:MAG TPA: hypothetical protein VL131_16280 [Gammaproteobacteria bacterium]|nr:hypothetical protein [Gammaproteobacteria bacterium]